MMNVNVWTVSVLSIAGSAAVHATPGPELHRTPHAAAPARDHAPFDGAALHCRFDPATDASNPPLTLAMMQDDNQRGQDDSVAEPSAEAPAEPFGSAGTWRLNVHGGFGMDATDSGNTLALGGVGLSYFAADYLSIDMELNGLGAFQDGNDAAAVNFNLLVRYHFVHRDTWSLFVDGGAGLLLATEEVPNDGSNFNFTPQAGFGFTCDIGSDNRLMAGVRWHHISNANTFEDNPGRDSVFVYAGVSMPF